jgi:hypothetical protein
MCDIYDEIEKFFKVGVFEAFGGLFLVFGVLKRASRMSGAMVPLSWLPNFMHSKSFLNNKPRTKL